MNLEIIKAEKINKNAVKCWVISRLIFQIIFSGILYIGLYMILLKMAGNIKEVKLAVYIISAVIEILLFLNTFVYPKIEYKEWSYSFFEDKIELFNGLFVKKRIIIPISRIQSVTIEQGPIYRKFGLATVKIMTAGSIHEIPALTNGEAENITERLKNIIEMGGRLE
jgi:membrane protein YdbS with pleckstrin-like domain